MLRAGTAGTAPSQEDGGEPGNSKPRERTDAENVRVKRSEQRRSCGHPNSWQASLPAEMGGSDGGEPAPVIQKADA